MARVPGQRSKHETVAIELVRALRGRRSQSGMSRRLGYRSNVVHRWELARAWPAADVFLRGCERLGIDLARVYTQMFQRRPAWLDEHEPASAAAIAAFLQELRGATRIGQLATTASVNRFTVSRWLKGTAVPSLPQLLLMVDAASDRLCDFISGFADPDRLPSLREGWRKIELLRKLAYDEPWSHAVLRALQLGTLAGGADAATVATLLGLPRAEVVRLLRVLERAGQVDRKGRRWKARSVRRIDTGKDAVRARGLKAAWARTAAERLEAGAPGLFGYSLFEISRDDLERIRVMQLDCARAVQAVIAESRGTDRVGLYCVQLLELGSGKREA